MKRKGIILAGGTGTRLHPSTISVSKQLMPVYDKPMIYYPLTVLMSAGIRDIMVITTPHDQAAFKNLLQDGRRWGLNIEYAVQAEPEGIAQALIIAEDFLDGSPSALILGDNLFFGGEFSTVMQEASTPRQGHETGSSSGATIFGYEVENPRDYGVVGFDADNNVISIVEKPQTPMSKYAVTGLYFYDERASEFAKKIRKSDRKEYEITALNELYLKEGTLKVKLLSERVVWLDTGTHQNLFAAAQFVQVIETRRGIRICCPEVESYRQGWIDREQLKCLAVKLEKSGYGAYLTKIANE